MSYKVASDVGAQRQIITVEDQFEYDKVDFKCLAMFQIPQILLVGEMRDHLTFVPSQIMPRIQPAAIFEHLSQMRHCAGIKPETTAAALEVRPRLMCSVGCAPAGPPA